MAFHRSMKRHILDLVASKTRVGLRRQALSFGPSLFFIFRKKGSAAAVFTTHVLDILGRGEPDVPRKIRHLSEQRFGGLKLQESPVMHVGMELVRGSDFSATLTQDEFARNLKPLLISPQLWADRQKTLSIQEIKLRQRKLGELRRPAMVPRPDICMRLARLASRANSSQGSDEYRINDLVKTVNVWHEAAILRYLPPLPCGEIGAGAR